MKIYLKRISPDTVMDEESVRNVVDFEVKDNCRLIDLLKDIYESGFNNETNVYINRDKIDVENFDVELKEGDLLTINENPGWNIVIMIVINIVIGLIMNYLFKPKEPDVGVSSSIYSTSSSQIEAKLNDAIPVQFGRMRRHTALVANDYKFYRNNVEYHMINTCLGFGDYDINKVYINDSMISDLSVYDNSENEGSTSQYTILGSTGKNGSSDSKGLLNFIVGKNDALEVYAKLQLSMPVNTYEIQDEKGELVETGTFEFVIEFFLTNNTSSSTTAFSKNAAGEYNLSIIKDSSYTLEYIIKKIDFIELIEKTKPGFKVIVNEQEIAMGCGIIDPDSINKFIYTNQYDIQVQYTNSSDSSYVCSRNISPRSFINDDAVEGYNSMYASYKEKLTSIDLTFNYNTAYTDFESDSTPHQKKEPITFQVAMYRTDEKQDAIFKEFTYFNGAGPSSETIDNVAYGQYNVFITNISSLATTVYKNGSVIYNDSNTSCTAVINKSTAFNNFYNAGDMVQVFQYDSIEKSGFLPGLKDAFKNEDGTIDNKIGFISHIPSELSGVDMKPALFQDAPGPQSIAEAINDAPKDPIQVEPAGETGWTVVNANNTQISMCLINLNFRAGIFGVGDDEPNWLGQGGNIGDDITATVKFEFHFREIDEEDVPTGFSKVIPLTYIEKTRIQQGRTIEVLLKIGRYQIKVVRLDTKLKNDQKDAVLESVIGLEPTSRLENSANYSLVSFLVKSNVGLTEDSGFFMNLDVSRRIDSNSQYKTLRDFVIDIWTNDKYGMNEDLSYLDMRDEMDEEISLLCDKSENAFDLLNQVLKSFGYRIYPYLNHFVIKKEEAINYRSMIFSSKNTDKITFSYNIPDDLEIIKGVKCQYIPEDELNLESYYFPDDNRPDYDTTLLMGVNSKEQAKKMATFIYDKRIKLIKNCQVSTDLEGIVPEIGSKVGVSTEYLDDVLAATGKEVLGNVITLRQEVELKANTQYYAIIETISNTSTEIFQVEQVLIDTMTNEIISLDPIFEIDEEFFVTIGDKVNVVEDFLITYIEPGEMDEDLSSPTKVNLVLQEYVEDIYLTTED